MSEKFKEVNFLLFGVFAALLDGPFLFFDVDSNKRSDEDFSLDDLSDNAL